MISLVDIGPLNEVYAKEVFNFYIITIIDEISSLQVGCGLGLIRLNIVVYADDVVLLANSPEDANFIYEKFKRLIDKHKLKVNKIKSKCMIFRVSNNVPNTILDEILL